MKKRLALATLAFTIIPFTLVANAKILRKNISPRDLPFTIKCTSTRDGETFLTLKITKKAAYTRDEFVVRFKRRGKQFYRGKDFNEAVKGFERQYKKKCDPSVRHKGV